MSSSLARRVCTNAATCFCLPLGTCSISVVSRRHFRLISSLLHFRHFFSQVQVFVLRSESLPLQAGDMVPLHDGHFSVQAFLFDLNLDMCLIRHDQEQSQAGFWSALRNALILLYSVNTVLWPVRATKSLGYTESATLNEHPKPKAQSPNLIPPPIGSILQLGAFKSTIHGIFKEVSTVIKFVISLSTFKWLRLRRWKRWNMA